MLSDNLGPMSAAPANQSIWVLLISALFLLPACQSQNLFGNQQATGFTVEVAQIFVEGKDRGTTPQTIRIFRGRQELNIALKQGRKTVRTFTLEETYSPNASQLDYSFFGIDEDGTLRFTVEELPTQDDMNFVIPFYEQLVTVKDNQYGLTLLIAD